MHHFKLENALNTLLNKDSIQDYCPNGLQVQGRSNVQKLITGVTASQALIDIAIAQKADAILVHHGYFWKGEPQAITHMKQSRIKALLEHDINLYAYHLPLDVHPELGNNTQLANLLGITVENHLPVKPKGVLMQGRLSTSVSASNFAEQIAHKLHRTPIVLGETDKLIETIAWCTGGGQGYLETAAQAGIDAFITGEVSEQTTHIANEYGITFFAAGHHATERYGVKALGEYCAVNFGLDVQFMDINNPI